MKSNSKGFFFIEKLKKLIRNTIKETLDSYNFMLPVMVSEVHNDRVKVKIRPEGILSKEAQKHNNTKYKNLGEVEAFIMTNPYLHADVQKGDFGLLLCLDYLSSESDMKLNSYKPTAKWNNINNGWFLPMGQNPNHTNTSNNLIIHGRDKKVTIKNTNTDLKALLNEMVEKMNDLATSTETALGGELKDSLAKSVLYTPTAIPIAKNQIKALKPKIESLLDDK